MGIEGSKKKLLLHSCCGPCSTAVLKRLLPDHRITVFYFNPNITDPAEYRHRLAEQVRFIKEYSEAARERIDLLEGPYDPKAYYSAVRGLEQEPEGGARCGLCFYMRMQETARQASEGGFDCFDTTLSVSPHKNFEVISRLGQELARIWDVEYLNGNYKKNEGFRESIALSGEYGLYRQNYCGCSFSRVIL